MTDSSALNLAVSLAAAGAVTAAKARARAGRGGAVAQTRPEDPAWLWWLEAGVYVGITSLFYLRTLTVTADLSARYKALVVDEHRRPAHVSGLHETWLSPWLQGRLMDVKDAQYHEFRDMLPMLVGGMLVYLGLAAVVRWLVRFKPRAVRARARAAYIALVGLGAGLVYHEADTLKILALVAVNYAVAHISMSAHWATPALLWTLNLAILYCNETYRGYRFEALFGKGPWMHWLDAHTGELAWHHSFNFVMLRMMSYNMDMWWRHCALHAQLSAKRSDEADAAKALPDPKRPTASKIWRSDNDIVAVRESAVDERSRVEQFHPDAGLYRDPIMYLAYLLYIPLYIAGPTITFNAFVSHLGLAQQTYSSAGKLRYAARFASTLLLFEVLTHFLYVGTISFLAFRYKVSETDPQTRRRVSTPLLVYLTRQSFGGPLDYEEVVYYSYWALMYLWFKFLLIWRFFRLWAVCDDVEPVENMERCMNNNFTVGGFWRAWHRSFNRWLVRYIYVPLGGNTSGPLRKAFNILVVFTFVGFWHDIKPELFAWGWLLSLFFVPEIVADQVSRLDGMRSWMDAHPLSTRWLVSFLGACNIIMLKVANIVGYTTGLEGAALLWDALQSWDGIAFVLLYLSYMMLGVHAMLFIRDSRRERDVSTTAAKRI